VVALHFAKRKKTFRNVLALKNGARQNGRRRVDNLVGRREVRGPVRRVDRPRPFCGVADRRQQASAFMQSRACFVQVPLQSFRNQEAAPMQMITRRVNEGLVIENGIHVTVLDICQDYVRLAISSPNNTPPYREETLYWEEAEQQPAPELLLQ
jgi:carbon storage regulator CsrA